MSVLETLTEGIKERSLQNEGAALLEKWDKTGLLEGLGSNYSKNNMARLLENQASQLLKEASSMAGGDVQGFASVAFPIVRRVFGGLIANDLVSVQPMSLPSGLIFFMDFLFNEAKAGSMVADTSLYGGGRVGAEITGGVVLTGLNSQRGFYALNNGYSSPTGSASTTYAVGVASGTLGAAIVEGPGAPTFPLTLLDDFGAVTINNITEYVNYVMRDDPDLSGSKFVIGRVTGKASAFDQLNLENYITLTPMTTLPSTVQDPLVLGGGMARRLTQDDPATADALLIAAFGTGSTTVDTLSASIAAVANWTFAITDDFGGTAPIGGVAGATNWGLEGAGGQFSEGLGNSGINVDIPEIDIKVDSIAVTAITKKLKAKWTPELGQDLNAYHNLDAEVELTQILSEQIALEIDREILNDLVQGAKAGKYFWSRSPGKFVNKETGADNSNGTSPPDFTGNVSEWYETLVETINDVSAQIHRKTLRGGANFIVCSPEVANILEFTAGFRASVTADADRGTVGAVKVGALSKKWDVYVDPYFIRNVVLVGRKGGSFLESGYVYAPYVPLQVTPTIFGTEDFVPRKGVMTRYAKKMVRPDMYGIVIVTELLGGV